MQLKPGVLCLIIGAAYKHDPVGMECVVESGPSTFRLEGPEGVRDVYSCLVKIKTGETYGIETRYLLPIEPDPDQRYDEKEKQKPRELVTVE